ncbi:hypothetical protein CR155_04040 [Pollutimonas nitritireducens]|uniref:Uncharacterized protein n=1 Tax=Pollutimonas nitritireducens TaxID=2045209 RepID=A0A2N4UK58_9BURK|nr:hypothetical protein [Pollutimonas nitritireducens]PLC55378.1 hypothetical protein CR155_04040 [Pollutimonas nitritireducens]
MVANELFRLVSLRQSNTPDDEREPANRPDPRLRHRDIISRQANIVAAQRDGELKDLTTRHAQLSRKIKDIETLQRVVMKTAMVENREAVSKALRASSPRSPADVATKPNEHLNRLIQDRLTAPQKALYQETLAGLGTTVDFDDLVIALDIGAYITEANHICSEIRAIEENLSQGLPTVPGAAAGEPKPVVSAVGWGELVVARESLVGYTAREIAHIENIMSGESKLREHERTSVTEELTESETITEKETEKDSQSTDRYELQAESQETISRDFTISTGVNTSGQYGLTQVDTSLDAAFAQSSSESRANTVTTAREIVSKAVERTFERVRKLRRLTITEKIRELNRHTVDNISDTQQMQALSSMYLWVEKIQRIELRHYGTRMMVEFHIPEPAVSLLERSNRRVVRKRLPPFDVSPSDVRFDNYLCLAQRYAAFDVEPPPAQYVNVGYGWVSTANEDDEQWAEDQFTGMINVPDGYRPEWAKVAWSALEAGGEFNFAFSVGGKSQNQEHRVTTFDGVLLQLPAGVSWPQGVPVSGRVHGHWDSCMYVQVTLSCRRTAEAESAWRLRTWEALRTGYEALERRLEQDQEKDEDKDLSVAPFIAERSSAENRRIERGELQKWAIKSMRTVPQNFNAIEMVGEHQEMSPHHAEAQAPIVRFYEDAFEWKQMVYFLYPYHWARRASWRLRTEASAVDPQLQSFLEAGAARVIVPVTPGYESKVLAYLDPENNADELTRILTPPPDVAPSSNDNPFRDVWIELLQDRKADVARGSGTLAVQNGSVDVAINADSHWSAKRKTDVGRELYIAGELYTVSEVVDAHAVQIDRPYEGRTDPAAIYAAGSTPFGLPWIVNVPTTLVVLADNRPALQQI